MTKTALASAEDDPRVLILRLIVKRIIQLLLDELALG